MAVDEAAEEEVAEGTTDMVAAVEAEEVATGVEVSVVVEAAEDMVAEVTVGDLALVSTSLSWTLDHRAIAHLCLHTLLCPP